MGRFSERLSRMIAGDIRHVEKHDPLHAMLERSNDPLLTAMEVLNRRDVPLRFVSTLEKNSDLIEAKDWIDWELKAGEKKVIPHCYWEVTAGDNGDAIYQAAPAPRGSDFIYKKKGRPVVSDSPLPISDSSLSEK